MIILDECAPNRPFCPVLLSCPSSDLDYLSQVPPLVVTLGVRRDSMIHNPLMLENTLDTRAPSREGAAEGTAEPEEDEAVKQEKARLRQAEAALVAEEAQAELASSQASIQGEQKSGTSFLFFPWWVSIL